MVHEDVDARILQALRESGALTVTEVAEKAAVPTTLAYQRLIELHRQREVNRAAIGRHDPRRDGYRRGRLMHEWRAAA